MLILVVNLKIILYSTKYRKQELIIKVKSWIWCKAHPLVTSGYFIFSNKISLFKFLHLKFQSYKKCIKNLNIIIIEINYQNDFNCAVNCFNGLFLLQQWPHLLFMHQRILESHVSWSNLCIKNGRTTFINASCRAKADKHTEFALKLPQTVAWWIELIKKMVNI